MKAETMKRPQRNIPAKAKYICFITFKSRLIYGSDMYIDIGYHSHSCTPSTNNLKECFSTLIPVASPMLAHNAVLNNPNHWLDCFNPLGINLGESITRIYCSSRRIPL